MMIFNNVKYTLFREVDGTNKCSGYVLEINSELNQGKDLISKRQLPYLCLHLRVSHFAAFKLYYFHCRLSLQLHRSL